MIIRRLIVPLAVGVITIHVGHGFAQGAFPVPLQGGVSDACMNEFVPLRHEAEKRGKLIKDASERHAPPDEVCKLIGGYGQSEIKMIRYIDANSTKCGIPPQTVDQLKYGHKNTEVMLLKVCAVAQQAQRRGPSGPVGDFWTLPEKQL